MNIYKSRFMAALITIFTIAKMYNLSKCPLTDDWKKLWHVDSKKYCSVIKKDDILPFVTTWVEPEVVM